MTFSVKLCDYNYGIKLKGGVRIVIYIDTYWLVNFIMDYIVLAIVCRFSRFTATYLRIGVGAVIGATWAVIVEVNRAGNVWCVRICTYILIAMLMVRVCSGRIKLKCLIEATVMLYVTACVLGGLGHMIYYYTKAGYYIRSILFGDDLMLVLIITGGIITALTIKFINKVKCYGSKTYRVLIDIGGSKIVVNALYDSGNVLKDYYSGKPVSVIDGSLLGEVINNCNVRLIPYSSVGCESDLMEVITADKMYIYRDKVNVIDKPVIGISKHGLSGDKAFGMLLNGELLGRD